MNAQPEHPGQVRTTCPYCGVGCGVLARPGEQGVEIAGDPEHPANFGRLCSKGSALGETVGLDGRLLYPMLRDAGEMRRANWDEALSRVAQEFNRIIERDGPDAVAFYLSGQLLTEDYYVANKLMKGFIGSGNADTNSRLCMASSVAGHRRAFGSDTVPGNYEDLDEADLLVLVGSNTAWCHPILFQRMVKNRKERGAKIVVVDPRRTASGEEADLFLPIAPGTDTVLFSGLLAYLDDEGALNPDFIGKHTEGFDAALFRARQIAPDLDRVSRATGVSRDDIEKFFSLFRGTERAVTCYSQGVNQSAQGTDKVNAIVNCHLATGRIGRPGMGPFSLTGQPNAMGGRETGGLANQLAAHMYFSPEETDRVRRFWNAPRIATREGLKAVQMFEAIAEGRIKALWIMATNPAVSLPCAGAVREALKRLEFLAISENVLSNDTVNTGADVLLPAAAWGEKDGTVTNSERRISRQRAFLPLPGEAKPDWWIVSQVAGKMGFADAFSFGSAADVFREHAALSAFENGGARDFDLGGLKQISDAEFAALPPVQWPVRDRGKGQARFFANGGFFTPSRRARFVAPEQPALQGALSDEFPLYLNTGRIRDQWHTMTRSGKSPRLAAHLSEPFVEVHPADAAKFSLEDGGFARVTTPHGECVLKVMVSEGQRQGSLFAPIHWSTETSSSARIGELVTPATDPVSGQPELKATPASVAPVAFAHRGFVMSRVPVSLPAEAWWVKVSLRGGFGYLLAGNAGLSAWRDLAQGIFAARDVAEYVDEPRGIYRAAALEAGKLKACIFIGPPSAVSSQWNAVKSVFESGAIEDAQRRSLLSGKTVHGIASDGPVVCACFGIGLKPIRAAIASGAATSVEDIGKLFRAGTNCGSCLPELGKILRSADAPAPAASPSMAK